MRKLTVLVFGCRRHPRADDARALTSRRGQVVSELVDLEPSDLRLERRGGHAQPCGGARGSGHSTRSLFQRLFDQFLFVVMQRRVQPGCAPHARLFFNNEDRWNPEHVVVAQNGAVLDDVLKLTDIARPVEGREALQRFSVDADKPAT